MRFSQILIVIKYIYEFTDVIHTLSPPPLVHEKFKSLCCVILLSHEKLSLCKLKQQFSIWIFIAHFFVQVDHIHHWIMSRIDCDSVDYFVSVVA